MHNLAKGLQVELTANFTTTVGDITHQFLKGTQGAIYMEHHDNYDIDDPDRNGLFLVEFPSRNGIRLWLRGHRIATW
jgi:hypothetical protein